VTVSYFVPGRPYPQGSKSFKGMRKGKPVLTESSTGVKPWRAVIANTARRLGHTTPVDGAVRVELEFVMPRPKSLPSTKPTPPAVKRNGDADKLTRAVFDALSGLAWIDDCYITSFAVEKRTAEVGEQPGVHIAYRPAAVRAHLQAVA
jgi:crossover junction endodeoxyribonuclease RusA